MLAHFLQTLWDFRTSIFILPKDVSLIYKDFGDVFNLHMSHFMLVVVDSCVVSLLLAIVSPMAGMLFMDVLNI